MNPLISFFPLDDKIREIRPNQLDALNQIWAAIQSRKRRITLSGSVGTGKSKIGETILKYFQSQGLQGVYTSPLNALVDQVEATKHVDSGIVTLKGKRYTKCVAKGDGTTADEGFCAKRICYITRNAPKSDRAKRDCQHCDRKDCLCVGCLYKARFKAYRRAEIGNTNASLWLLGIVPEDTSVLVLDEVDSLEDFVRMNATVSVPFHCTGDFINQLSELDKYADSLEYCLDCDHDFQCAPKNHARLESKINTIRGMINDYEEYHQSWVIRKEFNQSGEPRTRYEPVDVTRFIEPKTDNLYFVLTMSATPPRWPNYHYIEVPSPFPVDIRQCYYHPIGNMSKNYRDANIPKLAEFIETLQGKSLIHCVSYSNAEKLCKELKKIGVFPLLQISDVSPIDDLYTINRWDAVRAFKVSKIPNQVLLSVNLNRGVDFYEPDILNNIIPFIPFVNPTDSLVKAKTELLGEAWKDETTAITIEQSNGRIHRGVIYLADVVKTRPDLAWLPTNAQGMVVKQTIITDSNFNNGKGRLLAWYQRHKGLFSNSFNETVRL